MTKEEIAKEFDKFFEFPDDSDRRSVLSVSCRLFAEHIAKLAVAKHSDANCHRGE